MMPGDKPGKCCHLAGALVVVYVYDLCQKLCGCKMTNAWDRTEQVALLLQLRVIIYVFFD